MHACYAEAIARVLKSEGGYSNHPADPGGPTNFGVTLAVYRENGHPNATAADIKAMPLSEATRIYKLRYADPCRFDDLPAGVDYVVLDYAVNSGVGRANKVVRRVCGLEDGAPFSAVVEALSKRDARAVVNAICDERLRFLTGLKTWPTFGVGWSKRVAAVRSAGVQMSAAPISTVRTDAHANEPPPISAPQPPKGKGEIPKPPVKESVQAAGGFGAVVALVLAWLKTHPADAVAVGLLAAGLVAVAIFALRSRAKAMQDTPVAGIAIVPETK